ncbi:BglG family transcription antiterminator [Gracilibacillus sp. YIM 98692]|uniref:BglG family transcription antiterminator n=1 Tax=Gracilibacillus sp. YIM 98692 TaxID=2663532 RepID=UPI0013D129B0|nr:BglG family transcription antiterminator [Gracilibacillus sp. YIM 98692]
MKLLNKREVEILHLLANSKECQTGKSIALLLEVSSRTIRNDMKKLNAALEKHGAMIVSHKGVGYELEIWEEEVFDQLYTEYLDTGSNHLDGNANHSAHLEDEIVKKLLMNTLTDTSIHQEEFAEELFISLSALKSYLPLVKQRMAAFDLSVTTDRCNGIKITGNEDKIRYCISEYLFNHPTSHIYHDLFPKNEIDRLKEITLNALLKHQLKLTDTALENLIIHMEITIRRFMNKKPLKWKVDDIENMKGTKEFKVASDILNDIKETLHIDMYDEIYYITQHLLASSRLSGSYIDSKEYKRIEQILQHVIEEIKEKTSIDFREDQKLMEGLIIHLKVAFKRIAYQMNIRNEVLNSIKNNYPLAFQLAVIASQEIYKRTSLEIDENEIGFLAIHFGVALEKKGLNKQQIKKIMIVCGSGLATASLIREKILNNYGQQVSIVETISLAELREDMLDKVDLVVSTVPITHIHSEKIVKINPIISHKDLSTIKARVLDEHSDQNINSYRNIYKQDLFFKNVDLSTKEEVLHYMTDVMQQKNYIDSYTKDSIFEREQMASTELCHLLAIPHPLDNNMTNTVIAVCILQKPIVWDKEKVQVVIVLSVPKNQQKRWEMMFKQLYHFLIEDFGITKLISEYSYEDFLRNLSKYKE